VNFVQQPQSCICSFWPTQHWQWARFRTTFEFDCKYLWKK